MKKDYLNSSTLRDMYEHINALYGQERRRRKVAFEQSDTYMKTLTRLGFKNLGT